MAALASMSDQLALNAYVQDQLNEAHELLRGVSTKLYKDTNDGYYKEQKVLILDRLRTLAPTLGMQAFESVLDQLWRGIQFISEDERRDIYQTAHRQHKATLPASGAAGADRLTASLDLQGAEPSVAAASSREVSRFTPQLEAQPRSTPGTAASRGGVISSSAALAKELRGDPGAPSVSSIMPDLKKIMGYSKLHQMDVQFDIHISVYGDASSAYLRLWPTNRIVRLQMETTCTTNVLHSIFKYLKDDKTVKCFKAYNMMLKHLKTWCKRQMDRDGEGAKDHWMDVFKEGLCPPFQVICVDDALGLPTDDELEGREHDAEFYKNGRFALMWSSLLPLGKKAESYTFGRKWSSENGFHKHLGCDKAYGEVKATANTLVEHPQTPGKQICALKALCATTRLTMPVRIAHPSEREGNRSPAPHSQEAAQRNRQAPQAAPFHSHKQQAVAVNSQEPLSISEPLAGPSSSQQYHAAPPNVPQQPAAVRSSRLQPPPTGLRPQLVPLASCKQQLAPPGTYRPLAAPPSSFQQQQPLPNTRRLLVASPGNQPQQAAPPIASIFQLLSAHSRGRRPAARPSLGGTATETASQQRPPADPIGSCALPICIDTTAGCSGGRSSGLRRPRPVGLEASCVHNTDEGRPHKLARIHSAATSASILCADNGPSAATSASLHEDSGTLAVEVDPLDDAFTAGEGGNAEPSESEDVQEHEHWAEMQKALELLCSFVNADIVNSAAQNGCPAISERDMDSAKLRRVTAEADLYLLSRVHLMWPGALDNVAVAVLQSHCESLGSDPASQPREPEEETY